MHVHIHLVACLLVLLVYLAGVNLGVVRGRENWGCRLGGTTQAGGGSQKVEQGLGSCPEGSAADRTLG